MTSELLGVDMLDVSDFIVERGGDPEHVKESQRRRYASDNAVPEVQAAYESARASMATSVHDRDSTDVLSELQSGRSEEGGQYYSEGYSGQEKGTPDEREFSFADKDIGQRGLSRSNNTKSRA